MSSVCRLASCNVTSAFVRYLSVSSVFHIELVNRYLSGYFYCRFVSFRNALIMLTSAMPMVPVQCLIICLQFNKTVYTSLILSATHRKSQFHCGFCPPLLFASICLLFACLCLECEMCIVHV